MRAVVMAGGEGTRLRPLTTSTPKPLLPVAGRPILEYALMLLRKHGVTECAVTVQYLAARIRRYIGDGSDLGMTVSYATETTPLGTAGSVLNARVALGGETFVVLSGDAITDIDLTEMAQFHRDSQSLVTVALARKPNPLEFGNVITGHGGRIERFVEKPTWGQVFSDTVNTGIYIMEPEVLDMIPRGKPSDWSRDVFPALMKAEAPMFGYVTDAYWEDVGSLESYLLVQRHVLERRVEVDIDGFELAPGVFVGRDAVVDPGATLRGPVYIGANSRIEAGAELGPASTIGSNVVLRQGSRIERSLLLNRVYIHPHASVRGAIIGDASEVRTWSRVEEGAVIADEVVLEDESVIAPGVLVYPGKTIEAGALVQDTVIWESSGQRSIFGPRGVSGLMNVDITPETAVRLAAAFSSTLPKGATVTLARDHSLAARALGRAMAGALTASGVNVRDLRTIPVSVTRNDVARVAAGGIIVRTTPGHSDSVDIRLLDGQGFDLDAPKQQHVERLLSRRDFRRTLFDEMGDIRTPPRVLDDYVQQLYGAVDTKEIAGSGLKVVVDAAGGTAALALPQILSEVGVDVLTVNNRLDVSIPTSTPASYRAALHRLGELVASSRSDLGVRIDPTGERLSLVDETGSPLDHGRALLVLLDLVAAERRRGLVGLPVTTTRVAEDVTRFHSVGVLWTPTASAGLRAATANPDLIFAGDGLGGFIVPEFGPHVDPLAAFVRLLGLVARTRLTLSAIDRRIPHANVLRAARPTKWARRGSVMRTVVEAAGDRQVDTTDGVRIVEGDGSWVLVLPDPVEPVTRIWAEAATEQSAALLLGRWVEIVDREASR